MVAPTLVVGPTDEVRTQLVHGDAHDLSLRTARALMVTRWSTTTSRLPWPASRREHAGTPHRCAGPCRGPSGFPDSGPWPRPSARSLPTPGTDEDVDVLDIHLSCRLSLHGYRASRRATGPAPTPAKDLISGGSFPFSAVTSARLPQVTFAPASTDRVKTSVSTAAGPAPDHPGPPTR